MYYKKSSKYRSKLPFKGIISGIVILSMMLFAWVVEVFHPVILPGGDHPVELYSTEVQDDLTSIMSKAIEKAQKSVTLVIYNLTDPKILKSLRRQSESGILVKVICDAKNCKNVESLLGPQVQILKRYMDDLMHLKLLIIDEKQTWIGSANMTRASLRHYGNLVTAIESEALAQMVSAKVRSFTSTDRLQVIPHRIFRIGPQDIEMWFLPDDPRAVLRIKELIRSAKKSIRIAMFAWTRRDLANEVIAAKNRGVKVEVALDRSMASGSGEQIARMLLNGGVNMKVSAGAPLLHHKFMIVDGNVLVNGSANWTLKAFDKNDDCFIVIYPLQESQKQLLEKTWKILNYETASFQ